MIKNKFKILTILMFLFFVLPLNAQVDLLDDFFPTDADYLQINIRPENPKPNEKVSISLELYTTDLKKAEISWFLNGELQKKDFGETSFEFITRPVGQSQKISILIDTFGGEKIRKEVIIRPVEVDIVWNANTYTPPFYKGRSLLTGRGGGLTVTAIPNIVDSTGRNIGSQALNYKWYQNNTFLKGQSGFGKDSIKIARASIARPFDIRSVVETIDGAISADNVILIDYQEPKVLIYEKHPLYGTMFNQIVNEIELKNKEITLSAIPYFFSETFKNSGLLEYDWRQNGRNIPQSSNQNMMTFRQTEDNQSGQVNIKVSVQNTEDFIQRADGKTTINLSE